MKKFVEVMLYDKTGKMVFGYLFKTSTVKRFAGIKHIAELATNADAQEQLDSLVIAAAKRFAMDYNDSPVDSIVPVDHIRIINEYTGTDKKHSII